jgi:uncharacterized protein
MNTLPGRVPLALLLLAWTAAPLVAQRVTFPDAPPAGTFVVDEAGALGAAEAAEVDRISAALLEEQGFPIVVVLLPDLASRGAAGYTIERYAAELFDHWGIGSQERNYGMLLLVSLGDRAARIELGEAWRHQYDEQARQVMNTLIIPQFRDGRYSEGVLAGVRGMNAMARGLELPVPATPVWVLFAAFGVFVTVSGGMFSLLYSGKTGYAWVLLAALAALLLLLARSVHVQGGTRGGGGGGGAGGGGFRGGSSGGGGATGRW